MAWRSQAGWSTLLLRVCEGEKRTKRWSADRLIGRSINEGASQSIDRLLLLLLLLVVVGKNTNKMLVVGLKNLASSFFFNTCVCVCVRVCFICRQC